MGDKGQKDKDKSRNQKIRKKEQKAKKKQDKQKSTKLWKKDDVSAPAAFRENRNVNEW